MRYRSDDGSIPAIGSFATEQAALDYIDGMDVDRRRGVWIDPVGGNTTLTEFVEPDWFDALDVDSRTEDNYRRRWTKHIKPRWGDTALKAITGLAVHAWAKKLRASGLSPVTVNDIVKLLSMMLADAVEEKLIPANPIKPRRRGKSRAVIARPREKVWGEPSQVLTVADQAAAWYGPGAGVLILTGGWTGARWGELTGLRRPWLHLFDDDSGYFDIDPDYGCLHEDDNGRLWLGPAKNEPSARRVSLPPFLVRLLRAHLDTHDHEHVFVTIQQELHRRSNFARRAFRPAANGNLTVAKPRMRLQPACLGLHFHGLRHGHKTWMIADGVPEVAQAARLGHIIKDKVRRTYSHIAPEVEARLLDSLQDRWEKATADTASEHGTTWRAAG